MKNIVTIILLVASVGLAAALIVIKNQEQKEQSNSASTIFQFSNQLSNAHDQITGLSQVNLVLSNNLATSQESSSALSNQLTDAQTAVEKNQQEITNLDNRLADLEAQNKALDDHATELTNTIAQLNTQITDTQTKLGQTETNNAFLESELKKQVAERAALEQKFNDLSQMRQQVRKLRDDTLMAVRLRWMREGTDPSQQVKGGETLMQRASPTNSALAHNPANSDLNVEVEAGGAVRIIPPLTGTNPPPQ